jgi:hypothetical protein
MLDPASLERLSEFPERNDALLNLALAEEGGAGVLLSLARCAGVGAAALDVIAERVVRDRESLGGEDEREVPAWIELERRLIAHPNAARAMRDELLAKHADDPFFVLSAAAHLDATELGLQAAALWPSASPLHDRPWLGLLRAARQSEGLLWRWGVSGSELLREAAGRLGREALLLERLSQDGSRRVRRAVASNPAGTDVRSRMVHTDAAFEVRARARRDLEADGAQAGQPSWSAEVQTMQQGGILSGDVRKALLAAGPTLDEEGALLAARYLDAAEVRSLVAQAAASSEEPLLPRTIGVGAGLGLRRPPSRSSEAGEASLTNDVVHAITRASVAKSRLTGKARLSLFVADCLSRLRAMDRQELARALVPGVLASDRMVLFRFATEGSSSLGAPSLHELSEVPASIVELCWRDGAMSDADAIALCGRTAAPSREARELPEDELDLEPLARPLAALERAVLAAIAKTAVSPRAALAAIALEPRRCRYVLSAMPSWKGPLTGVRLARVLKAHAGALSAAARPVPGAVGNGSGPRPAALARWTDRALSETEAAIAVAVGDLPVAALVRKLASGSIRLDEGATLAAGVEARAAIDGRAVFVPLVDYATSMRTRSAAALSLWILLENLDRARAPSLIASAVEGLSELGSGSVVVPNLCEALAMLERRSPGRLEHVHMQSPRGRATIASAIARAYRAVGGMRDEG